MIGFWDLKNYETREANCCQTLHAKHAGTFDDNLINFGVLAVFICGSFPANYFMKEKIEHKIKDLVEMRLTKTARTLNLQMLHFDKSNKIEDNEIIL